MMVGGMVSGLGLTLAAPFIAATKYFTSAGGALYDLSKRTTLSATTLAELGYAARQTGAELSDVETAIRTAVKGGHGNDFIKLAHQIAAIEDPVRRAQKAMEVFGARSGAKLLPMIQELDALRARAQGLGIAPTEREVALADELGDKFGDLKESILATVFAVGSALAPDLISLMEGIIQTAASITRFVRENKELIVTIAKVAAGIFLAGTAITIIGGIIFGIGAVLGSIMTIATAMGTVLMATFALIKAAVLAALTPLGLLILAIGVAVAAVLYFSGEGSNMLKMLSNGFANLKEIAGETLHGIADALMSGDILLAGEILWKALQLLWAKGTTALLNKWTDWRTKMSEVFLELSFGIKSMWIELQSFLITALYATLRSITTGMRNVLGETIFSSLDKALGGQLSGAETALGLAEAKSKASLDARRAAVGAELEGARKQLHAAKDEEKAARQTKVDKLQMQFDALNQRAAEQREGMYEPGGGDKALGEQPVGAGSTFGTFSAAAAAAMGSAGGAVAEERRDRKEALKLQRQQIEEQRNITKALAWAKNMGFV